MKKYLFILILAMFLSSLGFTQPLTGTKTIPGSYATVALAISSLNSYGVGSGGVTFNVAAGYSETFASNSAGYITTLTGTLANQIVFQKSGAGSNPVILAATGVGTIDAIIAIAGCDYVTFDGINISENSLNTNSDSQMEWGYAILKASGTNGSQNITIKNCTITLNKENTAATGIYSNNHTISDNTQLTVTALAGANSNLKLYGNTLANCYIGISISGFDDPSVPYAFYDQNVEIGKDGANMVTNIGGGEDVAYGIFTKFQNNLKVANNTVTSNTTAPTGHPYLYGIYMTTSNNASYDFYGNTVTIQFTPIGDLYGNSAFYAVYCDMGINGTNNVVNVYNNTVTNCYYPNAAVQAPTKLLYFNNMGVTTNVYGNTVSNNTIGGDPSSTAAGEIRYMWFQQATSTKGPLVVHDNSVTGNTRIQPVSTQGFTFLLAVAGGGTTLNVYNNLVNNNIIGSSGGAQCLYIYYNDEVSKDVHNNTITNIIQANGSTVGLYNGNGTLGRIYSNIIRNISGSSDAPYSAINGIDHNSGAATYYYNNMISELSCPGSEASLGYDYNTLNGINVESGGTNTGFYNNTVYLNAATNAATFGSSAFCSMSLTGLDLRNNIFVNTSASAGTDGKTVGIRSRSWNETFSNFKSNYNNIYAGTPGPSRLIYYSGSNGSYSGTQTMLNYKTLVTPNDLQSVTELPPFVNIASSPYDLHLKSNTATQCEAGGFVVSAPLAITTDFDGNARFPNAGYPVNGSFTPNAPDIGADEFGGLPNDITAPAISYTPLGNTGSFTARTLTVAITDGKGVPITGTGLPKLYWKINSGAYQGVQGTYVSGNTYSFTFGSGVVFNDVVSYYIVAQDLVATPNVGVYPWLGTSGFSANPPACSTAPVSPSTYSIVGFLSGIKHVGVGKDYTTLTAAAAALNSLYLNGAVTLILDDNTYPSETYPIHFNANGGNSSTNIVTIKPNTGIKPVFSGASPSTGLIIINGLDYVTIDGSNSGGTDKSMTLENTTNSNGSYVFGITINGGADPSTNITLKNCVLIGSNTDPINVETFVIVFGENGGTNGGGYDNCLITNNTLKRSKYGIQILGSSGNINHNITISNNIIGETKVTDYIERWGIDIEQSDNTLISGNDIMGPSTGNANPQQFGIIYWNNCSNTKITRNKIHDWNTEDLGAFGIKCSNDNDATVTEISNNLIYNIKTPGMNPGPALNNAYGIMVRGGGNIRIWGNTIYLSGPSLNGNDSYGPSSSCLGFAQWATNLFDIRNNIFRNAMTNPNPDASGSTGRAHAIQVDASAANIGTMFSALDNNDYFIDGYNGTTGQWYETGGLSINEFPTLASWQTFTGKDANSITDNPVFTSPDVAPINLLPTSPYVNSLGVAIPGLFTKDFTNTTRRTPPDMGAYEWSMLIGGIHTLAATAITQTTATLNGDVNTNGEVFTHTFEYGLTTSYGTVVTPAPTKVRSVNALLVSSVAISGLTANTTYHFRYRGTSSTSSQGFVYGNDITFTTAADQKTLNLSSIMLEGLYAGSGTMNQSYDDMGAHWPAGVADHITVELHNATSYATIVFSADVALSTTGAATVTIPAIYNGSYYITIKNRNSLQTVSATSVSFAGSSISQSFGSPTVVFAGNVVLMAGPGSHYAIYGGDVNQDDIIDVSDFIAVDNLAATAASGYLPEDANGDGLIDISDFIIVDNNATQAIGAATP